MNLVLGSGKQRLRIYDPSYISVRNALEGEGNLRTRPYSHGEDETPSASMPSAMEDSHE